MERPLADEIRPKNLDEVVGQRHLLGQGGMLRRIIESGTAANMIFYGPPGTGKTTIANLIAARSQKQLYKFWPMWAPFWPPAVFCCIWMRSSISIKSSSKHCWNLWKMVR